MTRRYYHPDLPSGGGLIQLIDPEAQHAARVMRVDVGDQITLFDGCGHEAEAEIISVNRREVCCQSSEASAIDRESSVQLVLGIALPKPDRAKEMIERLTELGVASVTPIIGERTQRAPSTSLLEKLRRAVLEASKQCGRNRLLEIREPCSLLDFVTDSDSTSMKWIANPGGMIPESPPNDHDQRVIALIGPEGGWTEREVETASEAGFASVSLGKRILRVETAAAMVGALLAD